MNRILSIFKQTLRVLLFASIGGFLLFLALKNIDLTKLWYDLLSARYEYVIISMILGYFAFISRGIRWNYLLEPMGYRVPVWKSIHSISIGYLANAAMPRAGEVIRCTALHQATKVPINRLVGTVVAERVVDMLMLLLSLLLSLLFNVGKIVAFYNQTFKTDASPKEASLSPKWIVLGSLIIVLMIVFAFRNRLKALPVMSKIRELWAGFREGIFSVMNTPKQIPFILHTVFIWFCYYLMVHIVVYALPATEHLSLSDSLFIMIVAGLGMLVPAPAGIGSYHYAVVTGMGILGIAADTGMAFATLVHTGQFIMTLAAGFISLIGMYVWRGKRSVVTEF
ncbi:MAG: lysylphosphatidylglycerol synthase transmembrane domain-containing protein [Thermaurantimonas sp.]|uniref:lysylphosphatidylglycerol synthase transmembrane domain-containing protein n=1 Tax=Thermaurantimonas sp. TaxID=2681568 RepID=UPI00391A863F